MLEPTPADCWIFQLNKTINSKYERGLEQVNFEVVGNHVHIRVAPTAIGRKIASEALYVAEKLLAEKYGLKVVVGDEVLDDLSPSNHARNHNPMIVQLANQSEWLRQSSGRGQANLKMAQMIASQVGSVYILDASPDKGHTIKAVLPFLSVGATLSLPPDNLIGKPSNYAAPGAELIGATRARVVREGVATNDSYSETYEFKWEQRWWPMEVEFIPLDHDAEVMVVVRNKADHQRQYWRDIKDGLSR